MALGKGWRTNRVFPPRRPTFLRNALLPTSVAVNVDNAGGATADGQAPITPVYSPTGAVTADTQTQAIIPHYAEYVYQLVKLNLTAARDGAAYVYLNQLQDEAVEYVYFNVGNDTDLRVGAEYVYQFVIPNTDLDEQRDGREYIYMYLDPAVAANAPPAPGAEGSSGATYGTRTYSIFIDLDEDGVPEADMSADLHVLDWSVGRDDDRSPIGISTLTATIVSEDGKYQLARPTSELFGSWMVGLHVLFQLTMNSQTRTLFKGRIEEIDNNIEDDRHKDRREVTITVHNDAEALESEDPIVEVLEGKRYSDLVTLILDRAEFPGLYTVYQTHDEDFLWWDDGSALNAINAVLDAEFGLFYVTPTGEAIYQDRHYRYREDRAAFPQITFNGDFSTFAQSSSADDVLTEVKVSVTPLKRAEKVTVLWSLDDPIQLSGNETRLVSAPYDGPAVDVITPLATTDYVAKDLNGVAQTGDLNVNVVIGPTRADFTLTNLSPNPRKVTKLQIRGTALLDRPERTAKAGATVTYSAGAWTLGTSVLGTETILPVGDGELRYMPNIEHLSPQLMHSEAVAQDIADGLLFRYGAPTRHVTATIQNIQDELLAQVLDMQLSDRVRVRIEAVDIDEEFWVERIAHQVSPVDADYVHDVTFSLTPVEQQRFWRLDDEELSRLDDTTRLGW